MSQYMIRVEGSLSADLMATFPHLHATQQCQTLLHGHLREQCELSVVLDQLRELGVEIVEVHRVPEPDDQDVIPA